MNIIAAIVIVVAMFVSLLCAFLSGVHIEAKNIHEARILAGVSLLFFVGAFVWLMVRA